MAWISFGSANSGLQIGINNAPINNPQFYLPADRPETPPCPLSTVPFHPDPDFVDHGTLLDQIRAKDRIPGARIALVGLGGVGKSQLAIEYCHRLRNQSPDTWVFWIHASNAVRFEQSCREIADRAKIPGRQNPKANVYKLIYDWLNDAKTGKWVLILDSLDDDEFLHAISSVEQEDIRSNQSDVPGRSIWAYFAHSLTGLIIITSRSRRVVSRLVEDYNTIPVEPMDIVHATSLFEKKLGTQATKDDIIQLIMALDCMPLAIVQAAAYIKRRAPRQSVAEYLKRLRKNDLRKISLLAYEGGHLRRDPEAKNSILVTWQISFDYIREKWPSAAGLLSLMSFFDRQGIPEILLREYKEATYNPGSASLQNDNDTKDRIRCQNSPSECSVVDNFEADILVLRDYSLIQNGENGANFEMHCLVQLATQEWLKMHKQLERWKERFIRNLYTNFPTGDFENWSRCEDLFAHVQRAVTQQPDTDASLGEWASLLHESARFALGKGNFADSKIMADRATNAWGKLFSQHNQLALDSSEIMALAYGFEGQWKKAEELLYRVIENREQVLGPKHPATLTSLHNLEMAYIGQGRLKKAEELGMQVMENCNEILGPEHPNTVATMHTLAVVYMNQERWEEAEKLQTQVMEAFRNTLGPQHPETLASISNLASTYAKQHRWNEAQELEIRVMETKKQVLGPTHPDTLTSMNNLASTYRIQARWKDAELLQVEELKIYSLTLGLNHPDTLTSMDNLASTYWKQERWKEAEEIQVKAMEKRKQLLGPTHLKTLVNTKNLILAYLKQGRLKEAEELGMQVMKTCNEILGPEHSSTLGTMHTLALVYVNQERWEEAERIQLVVMGNRQKLLGPQHLDTLDIMSNLALTYTKQHRWNEAQELEKQVMETKKQVVGPTHPDTLTSMNNLALMYRDQGRWEEAGKMQLLLMENRKEMLGAQHPDTLDIMSNLASTYIEQGRWDEAEELQIQVMETRETSIEPENPDTLATLQARALAYMSQERWAEAENLQMHVVKTCKQVLGPVHPNTLASMSNLAVAYMNQERWKEAEELQMRVLKTCKRVLGPEHPDTLTSMANLANTLKASDQAEAALVLMEECSRLRNQQLGPGHPNTISSASALSDWRTVSDSLPALQSTEAPSETRETEPMNSAVSKRVHRDGRNRKRSIFFRLFHRS